ncbi:MAG: hypothetical protein WD904_09990 [Dehalococcoidia bacterium]
MRRFTIGIFLVAALMALAVGSFSLLRGGGDNADAATGTLEPGDPDSNGPDTIFQFAADTIIAGNTIPAQASNGAQLQGPIDPCVSVAGAIGTIFFVDFVVDEVPPPGSGLDPELSGGQFDLAYDGSDLQINGITIPAGAIDFTDETVFPDNDGTIIPSWGIFAGAVPDGEVVFVRIEFQTLVASGSSPFTVFGEIMIPGDGTGVTPVQNTPDGEVFIGSPCPVSTDLSIATTVTPSPNSQAVSQTVGYTATSTVTNNGPETAAVSYTVTASLGGGTSAAFLADCTTNLPQTVAGVTPAGAPPQSSITPVPFTVHCTQPSQHDFQIVTTVARVGGPESPSGNNTDTDAVILSVTAVADTKIVAMTNNPATVQFIVDNKVDTDGDTSVDEDPTELGFPCTPGGAGDNDLDGQCNEDGGHVVPITVSKTLHNNGPHGPVAVTDVLNALQVNPNATACGVSMSPFGPFLAAAQANQQVNLPVSSPIVVNYTVWLHCGPSGWGYDDDGDCVDSPPTDGLCDSFIDEDIPDGIDNDGDGKTDEDGPVTLPTLLTEDCADAKNIHVTDPATQNSVTGIPGSPHDACKTAGPTTLQGVHPFNPSGAITIDEAAPSTFTAPVDNDCLVTLPCKLQSYYLIPDGNNNTPAHHTAGDAEDQGGSPLAGVSFIEGAANPAAFTLTNGNLITDGDVTTQIIANVVLRVIPGTPCATAGTLGFQLRDGDLGDAYGDTTPGDDTANVSGTGPEDAALLSALTWPTHLDSLTNLVIAGNPGAILWARNVGFTDVDGPGGNPPIPINELIFDVFPGPGAVWVHVNHIGDPDFDADGLYDASADGDDDGDGIPDAQDPDLNNDGDPNSIELAQCSQLEVTQIALGTSQGSPAWGDPVGGAQPAIVGGTVLRVCNVISPLPVGHLDVQRFTREDIGTTTTIPSIVGCSGENDMAASICKDETPGDQLPSGPCPGGATPGIDNDGDTLVDEDPTQNGIDEDGDEIDGEDPIVDIVKCCEPQGITVEFDVENGSVPGDIDVQFGIVGDADCDPTWIGAPGDTVSTATLGDVQTSTITFTATGFAANEVRYYVRKYMVTCPAGSFEFNVFNNVSSASNLPDPNLNNNQAENELQIIATQDVDGDGVNQPADNCNWTANPSQLDTDGDGIGDACDTDDDDDDIPDVDDDCDTLPEDVDGVDDDDGCPDTDVSVDVDKEETYDVDVSTDVVKTVTITVTNGNYPANVQVNIVAVSTLGACEVRLNAQAGDTYTEFTTDETAPAGDDTLWSQISRTDFFNAGETKVYTRTYTIHCFQNSQHTFELAVDALPLNPVQEEDLDDNVAKNFPTVTAYKLADLKKVSLVFNNPPASVKVGESFNLTILGTLHNNGPTTAVGYSDSLSIGGPADCTWDNAGVPTPFPYTTGQSGTMNTSVNTPISATITVVCSEQSFHEFTSNNSISVTTLHVRDHVTGNNTISTSANIIVNADADLKVSSVTVNAPATANINTAFNVTVDATLHNNGPESPVNADGSVNLTVPADCTKVPAGAQAINNVSLVASVAQTFTKTWSVTCTDHSDHIFTGNATVTVDQIHVIDPVTGNNSGTGNDTTPIFRLMEKTICDVYVGPSPVPPAPVGPATGCPAVDPWDGGPDVVVIVGAGLTTTVVSDDLDYSSEPVTVKRTLDMTGIAGGPQLCTVTPPQQIFTEAEPAGLSTAGSIASWLISLPLPVHDGEPNWCIVEYTVTKEIDELHVGDITPGDLTETIQFIVARDTDGDGVLDNADGELDNCKLVPNEDQEDTNGNGTGDACEDDVDVLEKFITVLGPAAINLSDDNGRYAWVIGEMGNISDDVQQVSISISITYSPALPAGCEADVDLILPGQDTFLMLANEQKFQVFRVRFECHAPAEQQVLTLTITKCIELLPSDSMDDDGDTVVDEDSRDGVDDDGDSEDGEDPPNPDGNPGNDCQTDEQQVIIDQP